MYAKDPELKFNIIDQYSPHYIIPQIIKHKQTILDVGCNTGYLGEYLIKNKNCVCDGIDYDENFLIKAKQKGYRNTFKIDLYQNNFHLQEQYDLIMFVDILEHLPNPYSILKKIIAENLKKGGAGIICLPNIARLEYRFNHLLGKFAYEKSGIMHQDHLRFFTQNSAAKLIYQSGLTITKILPTGLGARLKILPSLFAFQFIFLCRKR